MDRAAAGNGAPARAPRSLIPVIVSPLIALLIVLDTVSSGGAPVDVRSVAAILVWWAVLMAVAFSIGPRATVPRVALACAGLLLAFALLVGISSGWAPSAERAFAELGRVLLYAGLLLLPIVFTRRGEAWRWADGMAAATAVIAFLAVGQRVFPGIFPEDQLVDVLRNVATRLSYPLGYWNGLAIFVALGLPLLLRIAVSARAPVWRGLALAPIPVMAATVYLSSSRGGVAVALVGALVFAVLSGRIRALQALAVGGAGSAAAISVLAARPVLVDGPLGTSSAESAGTEAALLILAICIVCGIVHAALSAIASERARVPRAVWAVLAIVIVAGVVAANPGARFDEFKAAPPNQAPSSTPVAIDSHLASGSGSGRWQFWGAALDQFSDHPVTGGGAGSYEPWWAQHGTLDWFVRNAHSLWLETLGELGVLGLLLIAGAFGLALGAGVSRLRRAEGSERTTIAALVAVVAAFVVGSALDWVWQLPAVAALALLSMGLLVGPATAAGTDPEAAEEPGPGLRFGVRAAIVLAAWVVLCCQAIPYLSSREVEASRRAARAGDLTEALEKAHSAETIEPWASTPRLQLALVHEEAGQIDLARRDVADAIERSSEDWRLQIVASRLALKDSDVPAARRFLARARSLNPRSRLLRAAGR